MAKDKVLFISQEISPYVPDTHMSLLGREISQGLQTGGYEVRTFMPRYGCINERRNQLHEVIRLSGINLVIDDADHPLIIKVATLQPTRMQVYFIDNDDYFLHTPVKDLETNLTPELNDERLVFFARGVMETARKLRWNPRFIQCVGWITALAPLYIKRVFADEATFAEAKVVFTLTSDRFEGTLDPRFVEKLRMAHFAPDDLTVLGDAPVDYDTLIRIAIDNSDAVIAVDPDVDPALIEYTKASGKPFREYQPDIDPAQATALFYKEL